MITDFKEVKRRWRGKQAQKRVKSSPYLILGVPLRLMLLVGVLGVVIMMVIATCRTNIEPTAHYKSIWSSVYRNETPPYQSEIHEKQKEGRKQAEEWKKSRYW